MSTTALDELARVNLQWPRSRSTDESHRRALTPTILACGLMSGGVPSLVIPMLGSISKRDHVSTSAATWVVTVGLVAAAVATPVLSRLADLHGKRRLLLVSLAAILVGTLLCASTQTFALLLVGRVLQGAAGALFPISIGIRHEIFRAHRLSTAIAMLSGALSVGGGITVVLGGVLADGGDYRRAFWLLAILTLLALAAVWRFVTPDDPSVRTRARLDVGAHCCWVSESSPSSCRSRS